MKKLAAIAITVLMTASSASAQVILNASENARMRGMGVGNAQIVDDFNIWINPAQINNYKNNVYFEVGEFTTPDATIGENSLTRANQDGITPASQWGGANLDAGYGTWGVYIGRTYEGALNEFETDGSGSAPLANRFDLFYGLAGVPAGVYLSYAAQSDEDKTAGGLKDTDEASEINVGVGGIFGQFEAALDFSIASSECKSGQGASAVACSAAGNPATLPPFNFAQGDYEVTGDATTIALLGRHTLPTQGGNLLSTLTLGMASFDEEYKETSTGTKAEGEGDVTFISLGTALNATPNPETLFVLGIGINYETSEFKQKGVTGKEEETFMSIPVTVGLEHQTFSKVKTRFGISKALLDTTELKDNIGGGPSATHDTEADGAASVSAGIGWAPVESVELDFVINQDVLFTGSYVVSGVAETLSSVVSATYRFK